MLKKHLLLLLMLKTAVLLNISVETLDGFLQDSLITKEIRRPVFI